MSKGSKPRPYSVTQQEYDQRWDAIFQKDTEDTVPSIVDELLLDAAKDFGYIDTDTSKLKA